MAFPYIFKANFEGGTNGEWDSESDTGSRLDFPHYSELARIPGLAMPYRGARCMRVDLTTGQTNDHTVTEGDIDIADGAQRRTCRRCDGIEHAHLHALGDRVHHLLGTRRAHRRAARQQHQPRN